MKMQVKAALWLVSGSLALFAQGTKTREDASKYTAHAQLGSISIGADLWGHYIPVDGATIKTDDFLVVEVALFAPHHNKLAINSGQFVLKLNGRQLLPQSSGLVTTGYVIPDMRERRPHLETDEGAGPVIVSTGEDPRQPKFPDDNNPANIPLPPRSENPHGIGHKEPIDPVKAVTDAALPEGSHVTPISGYLFFAYSGKLKHVKHAEIEYTSPAGTATLPLR